MISPQPSICDSRLAFASSFIHLDSACTSGNSKQPPSISAMDALASAPHGTFTASVRRNDQRRGRLLVLCCDTESPFICSIGAILALIITQQHREVI